MTANALTTLQINHMELLLRAAEPELDFTAIAEIISRDLSLTYSVLRLVNSAIFLQTTANYFGAPCPYLSGRATSEAVDYINCLTKRKYRQRPPPL